MSPPNTFELAAVLATVKVRPIDVAYASLSERRPTLTASARGGLRHCKVGTKEVAGRTKEGREHRTYATAANSTRLFTNILSALFLLHIVPTRTIPLRTAQYRPSTNA